MSELQPEAAEPMEPAGSPWGPWPTAGFSLLILISYIVLQVVVVLVYIAISHAKDQQQDIETLTATAGQNGELLAISAVVAAVVIGGLVLLIAALRRGITIGDYLCLHRPAARALLVWLGVIVAYAAIVDTLSLLLGRPIVPEFMTEVYATAGFMPLFWLAIIVAGPFLEELFFRGFMIEGLRLSWLGPVGAVLITSGLWAVIHIQYGPFEIVGIFVMGLLLGAAMLKTRSLWVPISMHALANLIATVEVAIVSANS
jgi:membrane protease YdiL (CAAX protease family)